MTAAEFTWELVKAVGGFAGFASTTYVIWDRFWQHTPAAVVLAQPVMVGSRNLVAILAVRNVADRPIILSWQRQAGNGFHLAKDDTALGVVQTLFPGYATAAIDPGATRHFPLLTPSDYEEIDPDNVITLELKWKFAQPIIWQLPRKISITIRKGDLEALLEKVGD